MSFVSQYNFIHLVHSFHSNVITILLNSMEYLSDRIKSLSVSQTIAMAQKSRELKAKGIDIISLSLG